MPRCKKMENISLEEQLENAEWEIKRTASESKRPPEEKIRNAIISNDMLYVVIF